MTGAGDEDNVQAKLLDKAIQVNIDEVQTGSSAPVAEQARLDVFELERLPKQRIFVEIDLADGNVIGRAPIGVDLAEFFRGEKLVGNSSLSSRLHRFGGYSSRRRCIFGIVHRESPLPQVQLRLARIVWDGKGLGLVVFSDSSLPGA